jgi:hypothetical protein
MHTDMPQLSDDPGNQPVGFPESTTEPGMWTIETPLLSHDPAGVCSPLPRGPGFWESLLWMFGVFVVQLGGALVGVIGVVTIALFENGGLAAGGAAEAAREFGQNLEQHLIVIVGLGMLAMVVYAIAAVAWRLRKERGIAGLGWRRLTCLHTLLIVVSMLPLSLLGTELQRLMFSVAPHAESDMDQILKGLGNAPLYQ